jgi:hypothetical protein
LDTRVSVSEDVVFQFWFDMILQKNVCVVASSQTKIFVFPDFYKYFFGEKLAKAFV